MPRCPRWCRSESARWSAGGWSRWRAATREVLAIAAVVGRSVHDLGRRARRRRSTARAVAQALEPALAGRLVEARADAPGRFGFAHAIVRDAVYDELAPGAARAPARGGRRRAARSRSRPAARRPRPRPPATRSPRARCGGRPAAGVGARRARPRARPPALQAHAEAAAHYADALEALELGAEATRGRAAGDDARARGRARSPPATSRPRASASARVAARRAARPARAESQARAALGFSEVQPYGAIDDEAIALLAGGARRAAARRQRAAGARLRAAGPAARPRHRPGAPRGAASTRAWRWRAGSATPRRWSRVLSAAALVNWPPERAAVAPRRPTEEVARAAPCAAPTSPRSFWARTLRLRDALEAGGSTSSTPSSTGSRGWRPRAGGRTTAGACSCCRPRARRSPGGSTRASGSPRRRSSSTARHGDDADQEHTVQRLALALLRRRPQRRAARRAARLRRALPGAAGVAARCSRSAELRLRRARARARSLAACARDGFAAILRTPDWLCGLVLLAEPVAALGTPEQVERAGRGAGAARRAQRGHGRRVGRVRPGRARRSACSPPPPAAPTRRPRALRARRRARARAGARPAGSSRRSPTGWRGRARRRADALRARGAGARARARAALDRRRRCGQTTTP